MTVVYDGTDTILVGGGLSCAPEGSYLVDDTYGAKLILDLPYLFHNSEGGSPVARDPGETDTMITINYLGTVPIWVEGGLYCEVSGSYEVLETYGDTLIADHPTLFEEQVA